MRKKIKLVRQPTGTNLCGQACVATIAGIELDAARKACGTSGKTDGTHLRSALRSLGFTVGERMKKGRPINLTNQLAVLKYQDDKKSLRHWVVFDGRKYYDPAAGTFRKEPGYLQASRVISHQLVSVET